MVTRKQVCVVSCVVIVLSIWALKVLAAREKTAEEAMVSTQATEFVARVTAIMNPDGVPLVTVIGTEAGSFPGRKELAFASASLVVGDVVRLVSVQAPGGKDFLYARPIGWTNSPGSP